jgi:hypothetical protein
MKEVANSKIHIREAKYIKEIFVTLLFVITHVLNWLSFEIIHFFLFFQY